MENPTTPAAVESPGVPPQAPGSAVPLCSAVLALAQDMQFKLTKNERKPCPEMNPNGERRTWAHCEAAWLIRRARMELIELEQELERGDIVEARLECADVANFMMMLHDNLYEAASGPATSNRRTP